MPRPHQKNKYSSLLVAPVGLGWLYSVLFHGWSLCAILHTELLTTGSSLPRRSIPLTCLQMALLTVGRKAEAWKIYCLIFLPLSRLTPHRPCTRLWALPLGTTFVRHQLCKHLLPDHSASATSTQRLVTIRMDHTPMLPDICMAKQDRKLLRTRPQTATTEGMKYEGLVQDLKQPEASYRKLGAKMVVGLPFKEIATSDTIYMAELPPASDKEGRRALTRLQVCYTLVSVMPNVASCSPGGSWTC